MNDKLKPGMDLNLLFDSADYSLLELGNLTLPTGRLIVADPLCCLGMGLNKIPAFSLETPRGSFPVTISVAAGTEYGDRYMAARLAFNNNRAVRYELALKGDENAADLEEDEIFGFPVDTGLACFCDQSTEERYEEFLEEWREDYPDGNHYDDFFAGIFKKSHDAHPEYQREGGDWINWTVPDGEDNIIMFSSGFGDGVYPCYWGFDADDRLCRMVVHFIDPAEFDETDTDDERS